MRLMLTADTVGGVWRYAVTLARAMRRDGHDVLLAVIGRPADGDRAGTPDDVTLEFNDLRLEWMTGAERDVRRGAEWLSRLARRWDADLVHLNQMAYPAATEFGRPTITVAHSDVRSWFAEVRGVPSPPDWDGYGRAVEAGLRESAVVVAPSRYQADLVRRHYGRRDVVVIHNGVDPPATAGTSPAPTAAARPPLVLSACRAWDEAKDARTLDDAIGMIGSSTISAHLLGPCDGPDGSRFVARHLRTEGPTPEAATGEWMSYATIYVGSSVYEPFGLAPVEAAVRGCALVLSDIGSFRELWDGCAAFFPRGDARGLAGVLREIAGDPARVADLAARARERAERRYTTDRFVAEYLKLYRSVLEDAGSAAADRILAARPGR